MSGPEIVVLYIQEVIVIVKMIVNEHKCHQYIMITRDMSLVMNIGIDYLYSFLKIIKIYGKSKYHILNSSHEHVDLYFIS